MFIKKRERTANFYQELQDKTLERLQQLSGGVWTDYNVHDPGVTIADNMNYALFELQYKLELPFHAFIGPDRSEYKSKGILDASDIFGQSIVTPEDYEQLILNEIDILDSCLVEFKNGYYHIHVYITPNKKEAETENIKEQVYVLYHANRNLCEDLKWDDIHILTKSIGKRKSRRDDVPQIKQAGETEENHGPIKIRDYNSFQLDFPDAYGLGVRGLPQEASPHNKAHVLQLKGYLLMMDFLMAHVTEQVQHTPQLISFTQAPPAGTVSLVSIPDVAKVVDRAKFSQNNQLQTAASLQNKKSGFLDILDTLYGEDTAQFLKDFKPASTKNSYRSMLTEELPELNRNRFRSFNKLESGQGNIAFKELFSLLHGKKIESEIPIRDLLKKHDLDLLPDSIFFQQYEVYLDIAPISGVFYNPIFNEAPQHIPFREMEWKEEYFPSLQNEISLIRRNALFESFLEVGSNQENYRMIRLSENNRWILVFRYPGKEDWMILGSYGTRDHLIRSANRFWSLMRFLNPERHLFYLVEHRLLQYTYPAEHDPEEGNTLSIIACSRFENEEMITHLESLLRERLPAHLRIKLYHIQPERIHDFEQIYHKWREALASRNTKKLVHFSESIHAFFAISRPFLKVIQ